MKYFFNNSKNKLNYLTFQNVTLNLKTQKNPAN